MDTKFTNWSNLIYIHDYRRAAQDVRSLMMRNFFCAAAASLVAAGFWVASLGAAQNSSAPAPGDSGEVLYAKNCSVCHGAGARGGDRAPGLANNRGLRSHSEDQIAAVIRTGIPGRMPPFELPDG